MLHLRMQKRVFIYTYGCQMNVHDSEKILGVLSDKGYAAADGPEGADLIIFNTCAIREKAEQKFYSQLGRTKLLKRKKKDLKIAVAGCVAQESKEKIFRRAPHVDFLLGPQNIHLVDQVISGDDRGVALHDNPDLAARSFSAKRDDRVRAWVSIMYGCNNFCSYCIVPYTRGREVSRPSSSIIAEIRDLRERGYREVTLLGQNVNSYRSDTDFPGLLAMVDSLGISRVRFVTSHPRDLSGDLIGAMSVLPSLCEHLHLPLQSASGRILHLMNRGYTYEEYKKKVDRIRKAIPGIALTADIISGFPGETEKDHHATLNALREIEFDGIFAFKYSPRKGTKASDMKDQVPDDVKAERLNVILKVQEDITHRRNIALEGSVQEILLEGYSETDKNMLAGRTRTNKIVTLRDSGESPGSVVKVRIERARLHSLDASLVASSESAAVQ